MKIFTAVLIFTLNTTAADCKPANGAESWVMLDIQNHQSAGLLLNHLDAETAVLIVAGSGPTDHNGNITANGFINNSYMMLATELHQAGYTVLRFDKQGVGKSAYPTFDMSKTLFTNYVNDVVAWISYLQKSHKKVVLIGHSLGGLMSIQAAQKASVDRLVTLASVADSGYKTIRRQMQNQPDFIREAAIPLLDRIAQGETIAAEDVPAFLNNLFHPTIQPYLKSFIMIDPKTEIQKIKIPTLNIIGDTDIQIQVDETKYLSKDLAHVSIEVIKGMNHVLKDAPADRAANFATYSQPELPLHKDLIPAILAFIEN